MNQGINNEALRAKAITAAGRVNFNTVVTSSYLTNEAFKSLRSNLLFCGSDIKKVLVTSTNENDGKSTVATELAKSLAEIGKKTILIDADMRKSVILQRNIKTQNIMGLSELLSDQAPIEKVLYNTQIPDFDVIFSGQFPPNPVELLLNKKFAELLDMLSEIYDYIIIDSPPLVPVIDAAAIATNCDGAILVISSGITRITDAAAVKQQLVKSGCRILGAVLNENEAKYARKKYYGKKGYYYYYAYGYGNQRNKHSKSKKEDKQ